jgi:4,5-DOPA dioxygenase extradiol
MSNESEPLLDWLHAAPHASFAHPTPEHFLPLFVALGAAGEKHRTEWLGGGWIGDSLAADNYLFQ